MTAYEPGSKGLFWTPTNGLAFLSRKLKGRKPQPCKQEAIRQRVEQRKASLAEYVAEGGSINQWSRENGMSTSGGSKLWRAIVADMGAQAV